MFDTMFRFQFLLIPETFASQILLLSGLQLRPEEPAAAEGPRDGEQAHPEGGGAQAGGAGFA